MHVSLNELQTTAARAATGAGLSSGLASSVAAGAAWLAVRGLPGLHAVLAACDPPLTDRDLPAPVTHSGSTWTFPAARAAVAAPSAIDLLVADPVATVHLDRLDVPLLVIGLAGAALAGDGADRRGITVRFQGGGMARVSGRMLLTDRAIPASSWTVTLRRCAVPEHEPRPALPGRGVVVDHRIWAEAQGLAARTYVPEDPRSRARGAGAGAIDNE